ncbi:MAG: acyloxyacyl hydrolase [Steroidobacteraceae bacterium]
MSLFPTLSVAADSDAHYKGPMLNITVGRAQIFDNGDQPIRYGIEYRGRAYSRWNIIPAIGLAIAQSGASFVYTDLCHDFWLNNRWAVIPSFGIGVFDVSEKLRLGNSIEFRSGLETAYRFHGDYRVGIALFHLSNGGLSNENPGTEVLVVSLCIPLHSRLLGN